VTSAVGHEFGGYRADPATPPTAGASGFAARAQDAVLLHVPPLRGEGQIVRAETMVLNWLVLPAAS